MIKWKKKPSHAKNSSNVVFKMKYCSYEREGAPTNKFIKNQTEKRTPNLIKKNHLNEHMQKGRMKQTSAFLILKE